MIIIITMVVQCQCSIIIGAVFTIYFIMIVRVASVAHTNYEHGEKIRR